MESKKTGLGEREMNLIQRHWKTLKQDIRMADIVDNLIEEDVLKPHTWEDLKRKHKIEKDRTEEFLLYLQRKPSKCFVSFRKALRENGYEHLAEKLDMKEEAQKPSTSKNVAGKNSANVEPNDMSEIKNALKVLSDKDEQKGKDIAAMRQEHEATAHKFEQQLASNLQQTNEELGKLKTVLKQKEDEIENLKEAQRQQDAKNKDLSAHNRKLENEREKMMGEVRLKTSERDEMQLKMKKQKLNQDKIVREKDKLQKTLERQATLIEEEKEEKNRVLESLQRERTVVERMEREKEEMQDRLETLENENEVLSSRPQTAMTEWTLSSDRDVTESTTIYRRQPTGLSQNEETMSTAMSQLFEQKSEIEEEINRKQIEQKYLKRRLRQLQSLDSVDSKVCVLQ